MILHYFTVWNLLIVIFHKYTSKYLNLLYLSFITMMIGLYISFINPRYFKISLGQNKIWKIEKEHKFIIADIFFHIGVFFYVLFYVKSVNETFVNTILLLMIYVILINVEKTYHISFIEFTSVFITVNILYYVIFSPN